MIQNKRFKSSKIGSGHGGLAGAFALVALLFLGASGRAQTIEFAVGDLKVAASAVSESTFRVSINSAGEAVPLKSIYLDPQRKAGGVGSVIADGAKKTLKTAAGELRIDTGAGTYALVDAAGRELIGATAFKITPTAADAGTLGLPVGWPGDRPFDIYGCGNGADALVQHQVKSGVGNGIAIQPFFWAPVGFATFVVGEDDNAPATCDGKVSNGAATWRVKGKAADLFLIVAPKLADATRALLDLTGRPPVPPKWTFGYQQSRWGWKDRAYIDDMLREFTSRKIPVDAFIFDFEWYTDFPDYGVKPAGEEQFNDFGFAPKLFPEPEVQIKQLHDAGVKFVGIRKPRLGKSETLKMIRGKGWGFQSESNIDTRALWYANPDARAWYSQQIQPLLKAGIDGWWNDEGEFTYTNYLYWMIAEQEALTAVRPNGRLWTLNRAFQPGAARLGAAAWTGDIHASWDDFARTPAALLNWGLAGMLFSACDIGGFHGETTPELLARWMEAGTFFPVMRTHSDIGSKPHFPWLFGSEAEAAMKKAIELRMRLVPMFYSLAHETHATGDPIIRPLVMEFPNDPAVANLSTEWLVGTGLLAAPVLQQATQREVYLPSDTWYGFATGKKLVGPQTLSATAALDQVPVYVRAGTILPLAPVVQHTRDLPGGPLELRIYPGHDATFTLYEDDGETTDYLRGNVRATKFTWNDATHELTWTRSGTYAGKDVFQSMTIHLIDGQTPAVAEQALTESGKVTLAGKP